MTAKQERLENYWQPCERVIEKTNADHSFHNCNGYTNIRNGWEACIDAFSMGWPGHAILRDTAPWFVSDQRLMALMRYARVQAMARLVARLEIRTDPLRKDLNFNLSHETNQYSKRKVPTPPLVKTALKVPLTRVSESRLNQLRGESAARQNDQTLF